MFRDVEEQQNYRRDVWEWFVQQRQQDLEPVCSRPNFEVEEQSRLVYMDPLFDCGTASYKDVTTILVAIHRELVIPNEMDVCVVSGDGQTYKMIFEHSEEQQGHRHVRLGDPGARRVALHGARTNDHPR